ncbi:MAG TPA: phosphoribosylglycinamide formyltransferase [Candidatus Nanopelagicaceae bacterium]
MGKRVLLLASGGGSLARAIFEAHKGGDLAIDIVGLISDKEAPVLEVAASYGVSTFHLPMRSNRVKWNSEIFEKAQSFGPDLIVSVGFMRLLAPDFVQAFKVINTHPSLLPLFPGAHAVRDALAAGAKVTGTSVHWVDAGLDAGPVISQRKIDVLPGDDEATLHERIKITERALIVETLVKYGRTGVL